MTNIIKLVSEQVYYCLQNADLLIGHITFIIPEQLY